MEITRRRLFAGLAGLGVSFAPTLGAASEPVKGGRVTIATIGEPPALDPTTATGDLMAMITQHIMETLYTFDENWGVTPLIAESMPDISGDAKIYTIALRHGIEFHNGQSMTARDVVASLKRWTEVASRGRQLAPNIAAIEAVDDFTVRITLKNAYTPLLALLSFNNSAAAIVPAGTSNEPMKNPIGTGPYKLKERKPDQYIQLVRYERYNRRSGEPNGYGGARRQYLDEIIFVPVPDPNTRIEGALAGQYDYADLLPVESYDRLKASASKSEPVIMKEFGWPLFVFNSRQGVMADEAIRLAAQASMNSDDMLGAAFGNPEFYKVDGALYPEGYVWRNDAGLKAYNQADPEKAAALLKATDYGGTPVRILTSRQYEFHYKMAQVAVEYLKAAGFKVDMQVVDWATLTQRRADPALWDMFLTHYPFLSEPALILNLSDTAPGFWASEAKSKLLDTFNSETDLARREATFAQIQDLVYEEVPLYKIGDFNSLSAKMPRLQGYTPTPWPYFWNAWLAT